ncbi:hypothetical protein F5144DRAFT_553161 [Chaetomium tenue]|uniref:Uncharacterized protein n=1 Tax=Chaetomium tenue TaxID=1854479 RepID=A0ACB7PKV0_9PEZI|nr:hypothetical protein F5144DRAFT_553161 [Chaetomium globosum]
MDAVRAIATEIDMIDAEHDEPTPALSLSANLDSLPYDIQRLIVWDEVLSQDDIASLRLTSRGLVLSTSSRLFYRIGISKLNFDRQSFLAICHDPDLAKHVHEVEWLELSWDLGYFDRLNAVFSWDEKEDDDDLVNLCSYFQGQAEEAFWLPSIPVNDNPTYDDSRRQREESIENFRETFMEAVDQLPNLHTFVSRPMGSERTINPGSDYPMAASLLQTFQDMACSHTNYESNDGLFLFIFPTMARATSAVHRLRWADEFPGYSYFRPIPPAAVKGLESLELCWTPINLRSTTVVVENPSLLAACSAAAPTLRHLGLCLDHGRLEDSPGFVEEKILGSDLAASAIVALQSLKLVSMNLDPDVLLKIIVANVTSLRHVHLENVDARTDVIGRMAKLPGLRLATLRVLNDYPTEAPRDMCEHALIHHINGVPCDVVHTDCDDAIHAVVDLETEQAPLFITTDGCEGAPDAVSLAGSAASEESFGSQHKSTMRQWCGESPKWAWGRFYHAKKHGRVYVFQVPSTDPNGSPTVLWKFTSRDGEVGYGDDPFEWFDEWDLGAGDAVEPTPYCRELWTFAMLHKRGPTICDLLGPAHPLLDQVMNQRPPEDAFLYDADLDPGGDWF